MKTRGHSAHPTDGVGGSRRPAPRGCISLSLSLATDAVPRPPVPQYSVLRNYALRSSVRVVPAGRRSHGDPTLLILTSLAGGPKHGHALSKDIETFAGVRLGPGTLYGAITRLEGRGLIEPVASTDRRRPYRLTGAGSTALADAVADLHKVAVVGATRLGLSLGSPA